MLRLVDGRRESVGESRCGVALAMAGIAVTPQVTITDASGSFVARVDFLVDGTMVVVEFDGKVKYATGDPEVLWHEKRREDRLRALGYVVVRVTWAQLERPGAVAAAVRAAARARADGRRRSRSSAPEPSPSHRNGRGAKVKVLGSGGKVEARGSGAGAAGAGARCREPAAGQMRPRPLTASRSSTSSATEASIFAAREVVDVEALDDLPPAVLRR